MSYMDCWAMSNIYQSSIKVVISLKLKISRWLHNGYCNGTLRPSKCYRSPDALRGASGWEMFSGIWFGTKLKRTIYSVGQGPTCLDYLSRNQDVPETQLFT